MTPTASHRHVSGSHSGQALLIPRHRSALHLRTDFGVTELEEDSGATYSFPLLPVSSSCLLVQPGGAVHPGPPWDGHKYCYLHLIDEKTSTEPPIQTYCSFYSIETEIHIKLSMFSPAQGLLTSKEKHMTPNCAFHCTILKS